MGSFGRCSLPACGYLYTHDRRTCIGMFPRYCHRMPHDCGRSDCVHMHSEEAPADLCTAARSGRSKTVREYRPRKAHDCPCMDHLDDGCRNYAEASPHPDIPVRSICSTRSCHFTLPKLLIVYQIPVGLCDEKQTVRL